MTHLGYIIAGWSVGLGSIGIYAAHVVRRGRALSRLVPADRRRWMTASDD